MKRNFSAGQAVTEYMLVLLLLVMVLIIPVKGETKDGVDNKPGKQSLIKTFNETMSENMRAWSYGTALAD